MLNSSLISSATGLLSARLAVATRCLRSISRVGICILIATLVVGGPANATEMSDLYTVQVILDTEADDPRDKAYRAALAQVLVKITGSQAAAMSPELAQLFPNPSRYVLQFRPADENSILISFDGQALENALRAAGQPVWGKDRPMTLIWLAIDRGNGEREIVAAEDLDQVQGATRSIDPNQLIRERVLDVAARRGIPVVLPLLDAVDQASVSFSDIWGGFDDQLLQASKRYGTNSILVGRLRLAGAQRIRWSYYWAGETQQWTDDLEDTIHRLADYQASQFAFAGNRPLTNIALRVSGIYSPAGFVRLENYLRSVSMIDSIAITQVQADRIEYSLQLRAETLRLVRTLNTGGVLEQVESSVLSEIPANYNDALDFYLKP